MWWLLPSPWELALLKAVEPTCPRALLNLQNFLRICCKQWRHCREGKEGAGHKCLQAFCWGGTLFWWSIVHVNWLAKKWKMLSRWTICSQFPKQLDSLQIEWSWLNGHWFQGTTALLHFSSLCERQEFECNKVNFMKIKVVNTEF